jgi:hypothetical protein
MKDEMGGACSTYGERKGFWLEDEKEGDHVEDVGVDGKIILKL